MNTLVSINLNLVISDRVLSAKGGGPQAQLLVPKQWPWPHSQPTYNSWPKQCPLASGGALCPFQQPSQQPTPHIRWCPPYAPLMTKVTPPATYICTTLPRTSAPRCHIPQQPSTSASVGAISPWDFKPSGAKPRTPGCMGTWCTCCQGKRWACTALSAWTLSTTKGGWMVGLWHGRGMQGKHSAG